MTAADLLSTLGGPAAAEINFDDDGIAINGTGTAATSGTSVSLSSSTGDYLPTAWAGPRVRVDDAVVSPAS